MEFQILLDELATTIGSEPLIPDESGMILLAIRDAVITIVAESETRHVVMFADIATLPEGKRLDFYAEALKANHLARGGGGSALAINSDGDALSLNWWCPLDGLDGVRFVSAIDTFIHTLFKWRDLAAGWAEFTAEAQPVPATHAPTKPPSKASVKLPSWRDFTES